MNDKFRYDMVIFDVGGTLIGFRDRVPFREFLAHAGLPAGDDDARSFHRRFIAVLSAERDSALGLGADAAALKGWWRGIFTRTWPDRPDLAAEMFRWFRQDRFQSIFPDVVPALDALRALGMPMAVLSNFTPDLEDLLDRLGLRDYFQFVLISSLLGIAKPGRRIFDLAVSRAGRPPGHLLYVGDHLGDDVEGAWGAGLDAVLIDRGGRKSDLLCPRIGSLEDLAAYVRPPSRPARAIILDMDGVVLASPPMHLRSWQQTLAPLGASLQAVEFYPLEGIPTERTAQVLTERLLGRACSAEEARRLAATKRALFRDAFVPALVPGVGPLLHDLRGRGYRLGLVTGSARSVVDESLAPTGVAGLFDVLVSGDEVTRGKPDPEPYLLAASRLGLPPAECLVVENAPLGIRAARAAGMECVALETTLPAAQLPAGRVFADAGALRHWLLSS